MPVWPRHPGERGGTAIRFAHHARLSAEQGKDVIAIPGSIHSTQARDCHALITQSARLVASAQDVLEEMKIQGEPPFSTASKATVDTALDLVDTEPSLLETLGFDPVGLDALQVRSGTDTARLQAQLMALELDAQVVRLPGGLFQRLVAHT